MMAACRAGVCGACRCTTEGEIERQSVMTLSAQGPRERGGAGLFLHRQRDVSLEY